MIENPPNPPKLQRLPDAVHEIRITSVVIDGRPSYSVECSVTTNKTPEGVHLPTPVVQEMPQAQLLVHLSEIQKSIGVQVCSELYALRAGAPALEVVEGRA